MSLFFKKMEYGPALNYAALGFFIGKKMGMEYLLLQMSWLLLRMEPQGNPGIPGHKNSVQSVVPENLIRKPNPLLNVIFQL